MRVEHRLKDKDLEAMTAVCKVCGPIAIRKSGKNYRCDTKARERIRQQEVSRRAGSPRDRSLRYPARRISRERLLLGKCERCPFVAEDLCQLDVDHIVRRVDGGTDDPENLVVLCANCHRLKTRLERMKEHHFSFEEFMARNV